MVGKLIQWSLNNVMVVLLLAVAPAAIGIYSFLNINVEAYPDPAPPRWKSSRFSPAPPPRKWNAR